MQYIKKPEFEYITRVKLPFDLRHSDPSKNYGIHGLDIWYILKGKKGAVHFMVNFAVDLPHVEKERKDDFFFSSVRKTINGFDVGYHSFEPMYTEQECQDCDIFAEGKCYYGGSSLLADEWVKEIFSIRGEQPDYRVWEKLEEHYKETFGEIKQCN